MVKFGSETLQRKNKIMEVTLKHRAETLSQENDLVKEYITSLPKDKVFFDLGACIGTYSILAYAQGLKICSFEVDEVNYKALVDNVQHFFGINDQIIDSDFQFFNIGIADKKGEIELRIGQPEIGGHHKTLNLDSFCGHPSAAEYSHIKMVNVDSLDNLVKELELPLPDYIKIDIDGSEYAFLQGAKHCLEYATSIIIELYENDSRFNEIIKTIESYGFKYWKRGIDLEPGLYDIIFIK